MNILAIGMKVLTWGQGLFAGQFNFLKQWKLITILGLVAWGGLLHYENVHLKAVASSAELRAQQAERTLSVVVRSQNIVQEQERKLEKTKEVIRHDAETAKRGVSASVKPSPSDALLLQNYARTINSRYANNSK